MPHPLSPTTLLPALVTLHAYNAASIKEALQALRDVYFPHLPPTLAKRAIPVLRQSLSEALPALRPKRMARLVHHEGVPDSGYASAEEDDEDEQDLRRGEIRDAKEMEDGDDTLDILRSDELERGYTIKWLTGLVKRGDPWISVTFEEQEARTRCLEDASRLLARFAGNDTPEEAVTRIFAFPFNVPCCDNSSPVPPITVELNDAPVDGADHTAVGLQSWGSAVVFADRMCLDPERYLGTLHPCSAIPAPTTANIKDAEAVPKRRILELGARTGLLSITAAHVFSRTSLQADIRATDYHPSVLENLSQNVQQNRCAVRVSVEKLDWCALPGSEGTDGMIEDKEGAMYDVVLAADVVYHPEHARWIRGCVGRLLKEDGVFWLMIPMRSVGRHQGLEDTVEEAFPVVSRTEGERRLGIVAREEIEKVDGVGRADEAGYMLFEIRWV